MGLLLLLLLMTHQGLTHPALGHTCHLLATSKCVPRLANFPVLLSEQIVNWAYSLVLDRAGKYT